MGNNNENPNVKFAMELLKDNGINTTDLDEPKGAQSVAKTPEQMAAEKKAEEEKAAKANEGKTPEQIAAEKKAEEEKVAAGEKTEINDDTVIAYLKSKGLEVNKIDDLKPLVKEPTAEEVAEKQKEVRENAIKYGLNNKKINTVELKAYNVDAEKSVRDIVYPIMVAQWKAADKELSDEDAEARFEDYFKEKLPTDNWERVERTHEMEARANAYFAKTYPNVLKLEGEYVEHAHTLEAGIAYNKQVEQVVASFPAKSNFDIEVDLEDGKKNTEVYNYEFSKENIAAVKEQLLSEQSFNALGRAKTDDAALTKIVRNALIEKELSKIVTTVARSHANKMVLAAKSGRKGVMPTLAGDGTAEVQQNAPKGNSVVEELLKSAGR